MLEACLKFLRCLRVFEVTLLLPNMLRDFLLPQGRQSLMYLLAVAGCDILIDIAA